MKDKKIYLLLLLGLPTSFTRSVTIVLDTDHIVHSFNRQLEVFSNYLEAMHEEMREMNEMWQAFDEELEKNTNSCANLMIQEMNSLYTVTNGQAVGKQEKEKCDGQQEKKVTVKPLSFSIEDNVDSDRVLINVSGVNMGSATEIQANVEFDNDENPVKLVVNLTDQLICLDYTSQYRFLSVEVKQETKEEQKKDQQNIQVVQIGTARHGKTLRNNIQLDQAEVAYNEKEEMLTIVIPKITKKKTQKTIPITIK